MSVIDFLIDENKWLEFLRYKDNKGLNKKEYKDLESFILNKEYFFICKQIVNGNYKFSIPRKIMISKRSTNKKRVVYLFTREENYILKMVNYLMYDYEYLLSNNCYSFRRKVNAKTAFNKLKKFHGYAYKVDISNYFNSIDVDKLLDKLKTDVESKTYNFFYNILKNKKVIFHNEIIEEDKGVIAGCAISAFLSNYYLKDLDFLFKDKLYIRYADDIIIFNENKDILLKDIDIIKNKINELGLNINCDKEFFFEKDEIVTFLGFSHYNGIFDISCHGLKKIKSKLRRKSRALRRWMLRKNLHPTRAMKAMNNIFNHKFYFQKEGREFNWILWYFPIINTSKSLKIIDEYYQECLRYIYTGSHNRRSIWKCPYSILKETGYRSLVHEYYKYKKENK